MENFMEVLLGLIVYFKSCFKGTLSVTKFLFFVFVRKIICLSPSSKAFHCGELDKPEVI